MSFIQIMFEFLIVALLAYCGWRLFLFVAGILAGINPFQKSDDMESDALTDWYFENLANPVPRGNPHRMDYGSVEQKEASRALEEYDERQKAIDEKARQRSIAADEQKNTETVQVFGLGCLLTPVVLGLLVFGILFSSKYPGTQDVLNLIGR